MDSFSLEDERKIVPNLDTPLVEDYTREDNTRNDSIKLNEAYIDLQMEKLKFEKIKSDLYDDVLCKVFETIRKEIPTQTTINDRKLTKKGKSESLEELVTHLRSEVEFLREEIKTKNFIIKDLMAMKSVMRNNQNISHNMSENNLIKSNFENCSRTVPMELSVVENEDNKNSHQSLNDQLNSIRINKHNEFLSSKKTNDAEIIEKKVSFSDKYIEIAKDVKGKHRRNIIICGDSMVNSLDSNGISSKYNNVSVRSFSGATSIDMLDFSKPLAHKKPDVLLFHVGTNDMTKNIKNTKENIAKLINTVKEISPHTEIVFSSICLREDIKNIDSKRLKLNKDLTDVCHKFGLAMIDNSNIDSSCLAKRKLHLNMRSGLPRLAKNIKKFLQS